MYRPNGYGNNVKTVDLWDMQGMAIVLQERERDSLEELEEAKQQAQTATHAFNEVRQARYDTFMKAFSHISAGIDRIFKVGPWQYLLC